MLTILLLLPSTVIALGDLWCHSGGHKDYSPMQCEPQTLECYKYVCTETNYEDADFVSRGCGVSLATTATGLPNESCHQAMSVCETLGGKGECHLCNNKHMCNSVSKSPILILTALITSLIAIRQM
ncbi:hypothetical protein PRIPAC_71374 [Pristionchus pacificus]|uniref:Uncharacterized protein n=1 Tax=Pristionchus pacificus TaxID=54126 RepID=A0A2A6BFV3_PRIPA|nr:hypothetical protein PRIPAC_71374 [Pristionchus pacificus]|eukprot:PDM64743.1 hypothetical protein PRIPAC_52999 [Pristionchus pacificus]